MNTSKKIIIVTTFMGILGLGGIARAMSTTQPGQDLRKGGRRKKEATLKLEG